MKEPRGGVSWEQVSLTLWSSAVGYVRQEKGVWDAYLYHNQRTGAAWTERRPGFGTADKAKRWIELRAEE